MIAHGQTSIASSAVRRGFTLLELLLALALAALVFMAIAMAIDLHLRSIDVGRTETEEAQLARAILRRMADDLRSAVQYQVIDFSSLQSLAAGAGESLAGLQSEDDFVGSALDSFGMGETMEEDLMSGGMSSGSASLSISSAATPAAVPGVRGTQYELQIDVSRLPRPDEFQGVIALGANASPVLNPSDIKTVSYFLRPPEENLTTASVVPGFSEEESKLGGLVRREIDRAVALLAAETGDQTLLDATGELIAPEVTGLEFRYFDGSQWLYDWDSEAMGGLPTAVEIALAITPRRFLEEEDSFLLGDSASELFPGEVVYRMVVRLPAAKPTTALSTQELAP